MVSLSQSFLRDVLKGGAHSVVVCGESNEVRLTATQLRNNVISFANELIAFPDKNWLLWAATAESFCIQFLALALAGKHIILPANIVPGTLNRLKDEFDILLIDREYDVSDTLEFPLKQKVLTKLSPMSARFDWHRELTNNIDITLYTSGSTGEPKPIAKTLELMLTEVMAQHKVWGEQLGRKLVVSTVSHQHIYGALHYILWPLFRGAPIIDQPCQYPEALFKVAKLQAPVVLVSSPTHLKRLPLCEEIKQAEGMGTLITGVFSSTGVLLQQDAQQLSVMFGKFPYEIFGSTETGGVAWRQQEKDGDNPWQPLPGVKVARSESGCLVVESAFMLESHYEMSDLVEFPGADGQGFLLKGRVDNIAKVEGKRFSITEMENTLLSHDHVNHAKVIVVSGKRDEVYAVIELNSVGIEELRVNAKRAVNLQFKKYLAHYFEQPLLPRKWRYPESMPKDAQGKVPYEHLLRLF